MPLKVIGAGFGRTGTLSMKLALEQLGFGPCHHMMEVFGKPDHAALWQAAADGGKVNWEEILAGYNTVVDWPGCYFWQELSERYPEAKVLLTTRDPQKWYDSCEATIFKAMNAFSKSDPHGAMARTIIVENTFDGDLGNRENAVAVFARHNQLVIDTIAPDRLLVFEASQGWEPLCQFLKVPVPSTSYPKVNTNEDFQKRLEKI